MPDWSAFNRYRRTRHESGRSRRASEDDFYRFFADATEALPEQHSLGRWVRLWLTERRLAPRSSP